MLIKFSAKNHRAIRDKQTLLMVAGDETEYTRRHRAVDTGFTIAPRVLTSTCIVGANGAGKSSLVNAMRFVSHFSRPNYRREKDGRIDVEPFIYHSDWKEGPSEFEVMFIQNDTLYEYGFSLTRLQVIREWLFSYTKDETDQRRLFSYTKDETERRKLFSRIYDERSDEYKWDLGDSQFVAEVDFWKSVTKSNTLFLSVADEFHISKDMEEARIWIAEKFLTRQTVPGYMRPQFSRTVRRFKEKGWKDRVIDFLNSAGIFVDDILIDRNEDDKYKPWSVTFSRRNNNNEEIWIDIRDESRGTKDLFELAAPILDALETGSTLVVDELNLGLHPLAFERLVSMFYNPEINILNSQLIFTTHDLASIEHARIDYDQIWLIEKNDELAAKLYPLSDYRISGRRSFMKNYLHGIYGAVPRTSRIKL